MLYNNRILTANRDNECPTNPTYKSVISIPACRVIRLFNRSTMWASLIFLLVGQACLLSADPIPNAEEPHNAFWWVKHDVIESDTSDDSLWLREWLANDPVEATTWIRTTLNNTKTAIRAFRIWCANNTELLESLEEETAVESWYVDQALDEKQDAATWESLKATRNDTEFAVKELRGTLSNESAMFVAAIAELTADENGAEAAKFLLLLMAAISSEDDNDSTSVEDSGESLWKKLSVADSNEPRNALWWVKQVILTDTSDETAWLREALIENNERATEWIKQSLINSRDTIDALKSVLKNDTDALNELESDTRSELWYIDQALDESQDTETWNKLKSQRNDTEGVTQWIRSNLVNSTQESLSRFREILSDHGEDARTFLSFLFALPELAANALSSTSSEDDDADVWSRLLEAEFS